MNTIRTLTFVFSLLITSVSFATDMKFGAVGLNFPIEVDKPVEVRCTVKNDSSVPAFQFSVSVTIKNSIGATVYYKEKTETTPLESKTDREINFSANTVDRWTAIAAGTYNVKWQIDFPDEVKPENNIVNQTVIVDEKQGITYERATSFILADLRLKNYFGYDSGKVSGYLMWNTYPPGTVGTSPQYGSTLFTLNAESYIGYIDYDGYSKFSHPGMAVTISKQDSTIKYVDAPMGVMVGVEPVAINQYSSSPTRFFGDTTLINIGNGSTSHIIDSSGLQTTDTNCVALIITGKPNPAAPTDSSAFKNDAIRMRRELLSEKSGMKLPASQIVTMRDPSPEQISNMLDSLRKRYTKIFIYYSGHGLGATPTNNAAFFTSVTPFDYEQFFDILFGQNWSKIDLVIDACYSGQAENVMKDDANYASQNITLITATDSTKTGRVIGTPASGGGIIQTSWFTSLLLTSMGDSTAESDGKKGISLEEAFNHLRTHPTPNGKGEKIDSVQNPQIHIHRSAMTNGTQKISFDGADLEIAPETAFDAGSILRVTLDNDPFSVANKDTAVHYISTGRKWNISIIGQTNPYLVGLSFRLHPELDTLRPDLGSLSMSYRENTSTPWMRENSSIYNASTSTITTTSNHFSQWAVSSATLPIENVQKNFTKNVTMTVYPNPASDMANISFSLEHSERVFVALLDNRGILLHTTSADIYTQGKHHLSFPINSLPSGSYRCVLVIDNSIQAETLLQIVR